MLKLKAQNHNGNVKTDLRARTYRFSLAVINLVGTFPKSKTGDIIAGQLLRSATSIGANIIEAKSSSSRRDFTKFYDIALKSANETEYWLNLAKDSNLANKEVIDRLILENLEISRMLGASLLTLKGKKKSF